VLASASRMTSKIMWVLGGDDARAGLVEPSSLP
jgi:hypothetical protein